MLALSIGRVLGGAAFAATVFLAASTIPGDGGAIAAIPAGSPDTGGGGTGVYLDFTAADNTPGFIGTFTDSASIAQGTPFVDIDAIASGAVDWGNAEFLFIFPAGSTVLSPGPGDGSLPAAGGPAGPDGVGPLAALLALSVLACALGVFFIRTARQ